MNPTAGAGFFNVPALYVTVCREKLDPPQTHYSDVKATLLLLYDYNFLFSHLLKAYEIFFDDTLYSRRQKSREVNIRFGTPSVIYQGNVKDEVLCF